MRQINVISSEASHTASETCQCKSQWLTSLLKGQIHFARKLSVGMASITILNVGWPNFSCEFRSTGFSSVLLFVKQLEMQKYMFTYHIEGQFRRATIYRRAILLGLISIFLYDALKFLVGYCQHGFV